MNESDALCEVFLYIFQTFPHVTRSTEAVVVSSKKNPTNHQSPGSCYVYLQLDVMNKR